MTLLSFSEFHSAAIIDDLSFKRLDCGSGHCRGRHDRQHMEENRGPATNGNVRLVVLGAPRP